jgi:hypothetical protein
MSRTDAARLCPGDQVFVPMTGEFVTVVAAPALRFGDVHVLVRRVGGEVFRLNHPHLHAVSTAA